MTHLFAARASLFLALIATQGTPPEPFPAGLAKGAYRVGSGISEPVVLKTANPEYPAAAEAKKIVGDVEVIGVVLPDGTVGPAWALTSLDATTGIDEEALKATRRYAFKPGLKDGVPVPVVVTFFIRFRLPGVPERDVNVIGGTADPPPDATIPSGVSRPGPGLLRPLPLKKVYPSFTASDVAANAGGRVELIAVIMADGTVGEIQVRQPVPNRQALETEAVKAVRQWTFEPAMKDGVAVPLAVTAFVEFRKLRKEGGRLR